MAEHETELIWGNRLGVTHRWRHIEGDGWEALCGAAMGDAPDGDDGSAGDVAICPACDPRSGLADARGASASVYMPQTPILVDLELIEDNPYQPRTEYREDDLEQLVQSIRQHGLLQAPVARLVHLDDSTHDWGSAATLLSTHGTQYRAQVAFGHRRLRAYRKLAESDSAFQRMPLLVRNLDDPTMADYAWSENRDRSDLSSWEEAKAIKDRIERFGWTQEEAAQRLGLNRSTVANKLRLLRLPAEQQRQLHAGDLSERQALALLPLLDLPATAIPASTNGYYSPQQIIATASDRPSEQIRRDVVCALERATNNIDSAPFADTDMPLQGVVSNRCTDCPQCIRFNKKDLCPNNDCWLIKETHHVGAILQAAHASLRGRVPYRARPLKSVRHHEEYDTFWATMLTAEGRNRVESILDAGCKNGKLTIFYVENSAGYVTVPGHPQAALVCHHGERKQCKCLADKKRAEEKAALALEMSRRMEIDLILQPAREVLMQGFVNRNLEVWRVLVGRLVTFERRTAVEQAKTIEEIDEVLIDWLLGTLLLHRGREEPHIAKASADRIVADFGFGEVCVQTQEVN